MRIALCFSGQTRSFDACYPSIKKHVIDKLSSPTIFVHTYRTADTPKITGLDCERLLVEKQPPFDERNYNERLGEGQKTGVKGILSQLWGVQSCNRLKTEYEKFHGMRFDWVIRIRPDSEFRSDFPDLSMLKNDALYIPDLCDWGGYFDHLAFGSADLMDIYCNRLDALDAYYQAGNVMHPETFLKYHLDSHGVTVRRPHIDQCLLRNPGEEDMFHGIVYRTPKELFANIKT